MVEVICPSVLPPADLPVQSEPNCLRKCWSTSLWQSTARCKLRPDSECLRLPKTIAPGSPQPRHQHRSEVLGPRGPGQPKAAEPHRPSEWWRFGREARRRFPAKPPLSAGSRGTNREQPAQLRQ